MGSTIGGGHNDPATVKWNEELGTSVRFSDLQQFHVVFLHALRDVNQDLRQSRQSPLAKLIDASSIPDEEKNELVKILKEANTAIAGKKTINEAGSAIENAFQKTAGEAFSMDIRLGMADPSFTSITRSLTLLLSNQALADFETYRNGLGLNNILYISMLIESFERRVNNPKTAGQILLIEEPEAHLHPQLQRVLYEVLKDKPFQTILSSHSTHITSSASISSLVLLTSRGGVQTSGTCPGGNGSLCGPEVADLQRYLDATRSTLLYARKVILVEGPAELFVIPPLIKKVMGIDLERHGVSVIPIYGVHFHAYAKIFNQKGLAKKCAIIADGDLKPSDSIQDAEILDTLPENPSLDSLKSEFVNVFMCKTTFERELTIPGLFNCLAMALSECGATTNAKKLQTALECLSNGKIKKADQAKTLSELAGSVLATAKRIGKGRFGQILSKHINLAEDVPTYIREAIRWLEL